MYSALTLSDDERPARLAPAIWNLPSQALVAGHIHHEDTWQGPIGRGA